MIDRLGFDTVDAGALAESWRFEPEAAAYTRLYLADPATPDAQMMQAPAGAGIGLPGPVRARRMPSGCGWPTATFWKSGTSAATA